MSRYIIDTEKGKCVPYENYSSYAEGYQHGVNEFVDALCCQLCFSNMQKDAIRIYAEQMKGEQNELGN